MARWMVVAGDAIIEKFLSVFSKPLRSNHGTSIGQRTTACYRVNNVFLGQAVRQWRIEHSLDAAFERRGSCRTRDDRSFRPAMLFHHATAIHGYPFAVQYSAQQP